MCISVHDVQSAAASITQRPLGNQDVVRSKCLVLRASAGTVSDSLSLSEFVPTINNSQQAHSLSVSEGARFNENLRGRARTGWHIAAEDTGHTMHK